MDVSAIGATGGWSAMSGASSSGPPREKMASLFDSIDTSGSGSITNAQFDQAFQTKSPPAVFQNQGADAIFAALDPSGSGSVSRQDFINGMSQLMASLRADNGSSSGSAGSAQASLAASLQSLGQIAPSTSTAPGSRVDQLA